MRLGTADESCELTLVIPTLNEEHNIGVLLDAVREEQKTLDIQHEVIVIDGGSTDQTVAVAERAGARVIGQRRKHFGGALLDGFEAAVGRYIIVLDADCSHPPSLLHELWAERERADIVIASRFIAGGKSDGPVIRTLLSRILNAVFSSVLRLPVHDMSSGFRLYRREILEPESYISYDFDIQQEILIRAANRGFRLRELPFHYHPRRSGRSKARVLKLCFFYTASLVRLWRMRNNLAEAPKPASSAGPEARVD